MHWHKQQTKLRPRNAEERSGHTANIIMSVYITRATIRGRRYARARKNTKNVKGAETRGPWFGATSDSITQRTTCEELIVMCCAVLCACRRCHVLVGSTGVICGGGGGMRRTERAQTTKKATGGVRSSTHTAKSFKALRSAGGIRHPLPPLRNIDIDVCVKRTEGRD